MDIRLLLGREADALCVAPALDVEDTSVTPAVLIVADKSTVGISTEGCLAGSRQTEEQSHISVLALVRRRVEGKHVMLDGHLIEKNREDTLLHLTGVLSAENDHLLLGEVDGYRRA
jgi:hypothetical protein